MAKQKIWLNRFSPDWNFVVNKPLFTFNGRAYKAGEAFDKTEVPTRLLRRLYESRKLIESDTALPVAETPVETPLAQETIVETPQTEPEIIGPQKGGWFKVMLGDKQIGESTRDRDEAEMTVLEWMEEKPNGIAT